MKRTMYILLAMLLGAALPSCINREESTPWKDLSEQDQERYFVNTFGYNMMATYYLWCDEVKEGLRKWGAKADPVETVRNLRYKEDGKEVDRWSMMTDDYQSFYDMLQGNSKTMGIELSMYYADETKQNVILVVNYTYAGSPAAVAGLKRGDKIIAVNDQLLTPDNCASLVNSAIFNSDSVKLTKDDDTTLTIMARDMYLEPILCHKVIEQGARKIGYLHYTSFTLKSCAPLVEVFREFKNAGVNEIVLDLRYNGGGYAIASELLGSLVVPEVEVQRGSVFLTEVFNKQLTDAWDDTRKMSNFRTRFVIDDEKEGEQTVLSSGANPNVSKLYVIITGGTASASESTVCGVSPYMDVTLVGEQSHGKYCAGIVVDGPTWYSWNRNAFGEKTFHAALEKSKNWGIYVMVSRFADKSGETICMPDGLTPDITVGDNPLDGFQLGDPGETMLAAVLAGKTPAPTRKALSHGPIRMEKQLEKDSFMILDKPSIK